jgi:hypothetical protein
MAEDHAGYPERARERGVERSLTIVRTCHLQQLNALVYLTGAIVAHRHRLPAASLLRHVHTT